MRIDESRLRPGVIELGAASCEIGMSARVPPHLRASCREIAAVHVAPDARGQGLATALMLEIIRVADLERLGLVLEVGAAPDSPVDDAGLANWYAKLGFITLQQPRPGRQRVMVRLVYGMMPERIAYDPETGAVCDFVPPRPESMRDPIEAIERPEGAPVH